MAGLLAVMVVFNRDVAESPTIRSLLSTTQPDSSPFTRFKLVIYDNSAKRHETAVALPFPHEYVYNARNEGLAKAYNYALHVAERENYDWIMLLDHDSAFTQDYFLRTAEALQRIGDDRDIVACVPKMLHGNRMFSPSVVRWGAIHRNIDRRHVGVMRKEVMAIGSCTVVRTEFITGIGGFNEVFWLDCLDRWLFHTIHAARKRVYVVDAQVKHELSIFDFDRLMSEERYLNQLKYETLFMRSYKSKLENLFFLVRLLKRSLVLLFVAKSPTYSRITIRHLLSLLHS